MPNLRAVIAAVRIDGRARDTRCPAHEDDRASLSVGRGDDGRVLLKCHAGCAVESIIGAVGLTWTDLHAPRNGQPIKSTIVATYDYIDEQGQPYQVVRFEPKDFRQRRPDGNGGWIWNLKGIRRALYRLSDLQNRKTICIVEGEKDADQLWRIGVPATTNAGGAGKWRDEYTAQLKAAGCRQIVVLPDHDPPGETHGRDVARSCSAAGLIVKLIPLPGLPPKGDVSDYLTTHSKNALCTIISEAPLFDPSRSVAADMPITFTSLADLLNETDTHIDYLVQDRIPTGSVVLFVAPPKAGKSTAARALALAVARGEPWLGWPTTCGAVWYLAFEDHRREVRRHFRQMGATGTEPIRLFIDQAPADLLPRLHALAEQDRPSLIIVDTLSRLIKAKDFNDYAEITQRFEPLLKLSRTTGATLFVLHHGSAHARREGVDAVLGSTAVSASVDNILILKRVEQQRLLSSVQRIGPDLGPTIITLDPTTGRLERRGTKQQWDDEVLSDRILEALRNEAEPITEAYLQARVEGRKADQVRVLRRLLGMKYVHRVGRGGKGDPFKYVVGNVSDSQVPVLGTGTGNSNPALSSSEVPQVPELFENERTHTPKPKESPLEYAADSGSADSGRPKTRASQRLILRKIRFARLGT